MNPYDALPYGARPFSEAHPDRLFVVARAFGRDPAPPDGARILELGCGEGGHLVPIAARLPGATCVGVDLSGFAIAQADAFAARAGARATFLQLDLLSGEEGLARAGLPEQYDYILAHGVYSWVPPEVREAMLRICRRFLAPEGVGYLSYNTRPGWHMRGMVAEMLRFHTRAFEEPARKVAQARAILEFMSANVPKTDPYGALLAKEHELVSRQPDAWVFHDLLTEHNHPFLLTEFVADLGRHGLQYVGDSDLASMLPERLPMAARETLLPLFADPIVGEQYMDFLIGRHFRRSVAMLPRGDAPRADFDWQVFRGMHLRGTLTLERTEGDEDTFRTKLGDTLTTSEPLVRSALRALVHLPGTMPWALLEEMIASRVGGGRETRDLLAKNLVVAWIRGALEVSPRPLGTAGPIADRPVADALVRRLAAGDEGVPSVFHDFVRTDGLDREVLPLLDGTRTAAEVLRDAVAEDDPLREQVARLLPERFARYRDLGLLVRG